MHRFSYRGDRKTWKKTSNHQPSPSGTLFCSTFKARDPGNKDGNHRDLAQRELRNQTLDVFVRNDKKSILNRWFQKMIEKVKKNTIKKIDSSVIFTQINDKMWTTLKST